MVYAKRPRGKIMNDSTNAQYLDHVRTWEGFTRFVTYGIIFVICVLLGLAMLLL